MFFQKVQKFGSAMVVPALLFPFFGVMVGISTLFMMNANPESLWYQFWWLLQEGGWSIFRHIPLLFVIALPISLAPKATARAVLESFMLFLLFNYYIHGMLFLWGDFFGVDFSQASGGVSGLTEIAGIKTLDTSILGAILVAAIAVWLHNKFFDAKLPDSISIFQGSALITIIGFFLMIPLAFLTALLWPKVQMGITSLQGFMVASGVVGVWIYTFLERILIPTGLHHFIYQPTMFGPAVVDGGIIKYWAENLAYFAGTTTPLKEIFPGGGFGMQGNSKVFGVLGICLAMYSTAKPNKKQVVKGLLLAAGVTAIFTGITEPIEFTFLFISPMLFVVHSLLAATMSATMYSFGVVGNISNGLIEYFTLLWIPLFGNHKAMILTHIGIGLLFTAFYFLIFRFLILKFNIKTPGREDDSEETKLYTKAEVVSIKLREQAQGIIAALGGSENIEDISNCATRLRVLVKDENKVESDENFKLFESKGVLRKGKSIQVILGMQAASVREEVEVILEKINKG